MAPAPGPHQKSTIEQSLRARLIGHNARKPAIPISQLKLATSNTCITFSLHFRYCYGATADLDCPRHQIG